MSLHGASKCGCLTRMALNTRVVDAPVDLGIAQLLRDDLGESNEPVHCFREPACQARPEQSFAELARQEKSLVVGPPEWLLAGRLGR